MKWQGWLRALGTHAELNFLLTNRIPRLWVTRAVGRLSRIEHPWVFRALLGIWKAFTPIDLSEAAEGEYRSLRDVFTRRLRPGARPICADPNVLVSPCDGLLGACGQITAGQVVQAKGMPYRLAELLDDPELAAHFDGGIYATLRLTSAMYHRLHAPRACRVEGVVHHQGDTWNVNPPALARVERLFCRNERAVLKCRDADTDIPFLLVPVAAIAVACLRLDCIPFLLDIDYRGTRQFTCARDYARGQELGWFEQGSTVIVLVPAGWSLAPGLSAGVRLRMGEPLLRLAGLPI
jgi:phosphatidylserine decarboxylase